MLKITPAKTDEDIEIAKQLLKVYADYLFEVLNPHSLSLAQRIRQKVLDEANDLPGEYVLPRGFILLAEYQGVIAGCIAISEIAAGLCELKRIYIKPQFRRMGIGKRLTDAVIEKAVQLKYKRMRLHTSEFFIGAKKLYLSLGFKETGHIEGSPLKNSVNMELKL
jgi:ribosomal protein S18 acetylase RimI-like enzyme